MTNPPARAGDGMPENGVQVAQARQGMHQAAVANVNFRRFDQPLAGIAVPRSQAAHEQKIDQEVEIARDCLGTEERLKNASARSYPACQNVEFANHLGNVG